MHINNELDRCRIDKPEREIARKRFIIEIIKLLRNTCRSLLNVITTITIVGKEISVEVNNAMVLSSDVTSTE